MVTYNHERYIEQALNSVLLQKTEASVEIIVADDCSTDNTSNIILRYSREYPDIIRAVCNKENRGPVANAYDVALPLCRGEYLVPLEGDDYWTDYNKLQKQWVFMREHGQASVCFTDHEKLVDGTLHPGLHLSRKRKLDGLDIITGETPHTSTLMIRASSLPVPIPRAFYRARNSDTFLLYLLSQNGSIEYIDIQSSVYRITKEGLYTSTSFYERFVMRENTYRLMLPFAKRNKERRAIVRKIGGCIGMQVELGQGKSWRVRCRDARRLVVHDLVSLDRASFRTLYRMLNNIPTR